MIKKSDEENLEDFLKQFDNPSKVLAELDSKIEHLKNEIDKNKQKYTKNDTDLLYSRLLAEKKLLIKYQNNLKSYFECEEIDNIKKYQNLCQEKESLIKQISLINNFFNSCSNIEKLLIDWQDLITKHQYYECHQCIKKAGEIHEKLQKEEEDLFPKLSPDARLRKDIDVVLKKLHSSIDSNKKEFLYNLIRLFKQNLKFEIIQQEIDKKDHPIKVFRFEFCKSMSNVQYESFFKCIIEEKDTFIVLFQNIFKAFNQEFIIQIFEKNKKALVLDENQIKKIILKDSDPEESNDPMKNLENFIEIVLNLFTLNRSMKNDEEIIKFIGELWSETIFTTVIDHYFELSIPKSESELEKFCDLIQTGKNLELKMQTLGMIQTESIVFEEYYQNIRKHFATKLCQDFIFRMKKILKPPKQHHSSEEILKQLTLKQKSKFAICQISDYMIDVKDLFEEMAALLSNSSSNLKFLLVETIYLVCELFISIVPYRYRELIETNSKQNAIFHNNCLFFGHLIECLALTHKPRLDSLFELIPCARNIAGQIFFNQMKYQEKWLLCFIKNQSFEQSLQEIVNEIPSTDLRISSQSHFEFRECLNNCLKHLNHLHNSFVNILPKKISDKVFSTLICTLLKNFIEIILSLNDISSLGSSHLFNEIDYFTKELKLFLVDSEEVIFNWMKLNEINFLLKSSLLEILNRWADGKGILATYLKPDEVKHMIRALFQNNQRRANVLAKIK